MWHGPLGPRAVGPNCKRLPILVPPEGVPGELGPWARSIRDFQSWFNPRVPLGGLGPWPPIVRDFQSQWGKGLAGWVCAVPRGRGLRWAEAMGPNCKRLPIPVQPEGAPGALVPWAQIARDFHPVSPEGAWWQGPGALGLCGPEGPWARIVSDFQSQFNPRVPGA